MAPDPARPLTGRAELPEVEDFQATKSGYRPTGSGFVPLSGGHGMSSRANVETI
jgi:hypothetical protein